MAVLRFVADVHIGNHRQFAGQVKSGLNERCLMILEALAQARNPAHPEPPVNGENPRLVVLGDLFDTSNPSPQMIAGAMRALGYGATLLLGNHDMVSTEPSDHALAPFDMANCVVEQPDVLLVGNAGLLMLPFRPEPMSEWIAEAVGNLLLADNLPDTKLRVLCFHGGVRDSSTPKYLAASPDAVDIDLLQAIMEQADIKFAFCGNWHNHRRWSLPNGRTVVQVGALAPTGFDNPGFDYGYHVDLDLDTQTIQYHRGDKGPLFIALSAKEFATMGARRFIGIAPRTHLKIRLGPDGDAEQATIEAALANYCLQPGASGGLRALVFEAHTANTAEQEKEAAEAARTADTLEAALREYVTAMPLPDGVERAAVEAKVLNYMARE